MGIETHHSPKCLGGEIGKHARLKIECEMLVGSSPTRGTKDDTQGVEWQAWRDVSQGYTLRISNHCSAL